MDSTEEVQNIPENQDTEQKPKEKKKILKKIGLVTLVIFVIFFIIGLLANISPNSEYGYSLDHRKVINAFSFPDSFTIVWDRNSDTRVETWNYLELGETFTFKNGQFDNRIHEDFEDTTGKEGFSLEFEPKDFYNINDLSEISKMLNTQPTAEGDIHESLLGGKTKMYAYENWLYVGELENKIVYVSKNVQFLKPDFVEYSQTDVTQDLSDYTFTNEVYEYSFNLNSFSERIFEKVYDSGQNYVTNMYCYVHSEAVNNEYCGNDAIPVFSIDILNEEQYQTNIVDDPFGDMYLELGSDESFYYMFSHPNGDFPKDISINELHNLVKSTFKVKGEN